MYHSENFEMMTQYGEFGCTFLHNYALKIFHFFHKHKYMVSVEGSSIVLHSGGRGTFFREFF